MQELRHVIKCKRMLRLCETVLNSSDGLSIGNYTSQWFANFLLQRLDHFIKEVDAYVKPGDPGRGLLPHVHRVDGIKNGQGDKKIQAFNYRVCLTTDPKLRIPIEKPPGYREIDHELLLRNFDAGDVRLPALIEPLAGGNTRSARIIPGRTGTIPKPATRDVARSSGSTRPTSEVSCGPWRTIRACPRRSAGGQRPTGCPGMNSPTTAAGPG